MKLPSLSAGEVDATRPLQRKSADTELQIRDEFITRLELQRYELYVPEELGKHRA